MQDLKAALILKFKVSPRNAEIAALAASGLNNREIGERVFVSEKTVKYHLTIVYKSTGLSGREALKEMARQYQEPVLGVS